MGFDRYATQIIESLLRDGYYTPRGGQEDHFLPLQLSQLHEPCITGGVRVKGAVRANEASMLSSKDHPTWFQTGDKGLDPITTLLQLGSCKCSLVSRPDHGDRIGQDIGVKCGRRFLFLTWDKRDIRRMGGGR